MSTKHNQKVLIGSFLPLILILGSVSSAQISSALLHEGDALPGDTLGSTITEIGNSAQNSVGGYSFSVTTDGTFSHIWGNATGGSGTVIRSEATHGNYEQTSFESFFGMSDAGGLSYSADADHTSGNPTDLDGIWIDDFLLNFENEPINELIGEWATFFDRPGMTNNGIPYWLGGYSTNRGDPTENVALFRTTGSNIIFKGGDFIAGVNLSAVVGESLGFDFRYSALGTNYIMPVTVTPASMFDDVVIVSNGAAMTAEGSFIRENTGIPAASGGLAGEKYDNFDFLGITESGSYMITGDSDAMASEDEFVMVDGQIVLREGDVINGMTLSGDIKGGFLNENGDWAVIWSFSSKKDLLEALIVNGQIVLLEGQTVDWNGDGTINGSDQNAFVTEFTGVSTLTLSGRDVNDKGNVCFTADCNVNGSTLEAGFISEVDLSGIVVVPPLSFDVVIGSLISGGVPELSLSDDQYVVLDPTFLSFRYQLVYTVDATSPSTTPSTLEFNYESRTFNLVGTVEQELELFDYVAGDFESIDSRLTTATDSVVTVTPGGDPTRFVDAGTNAMQARISYQNSLPFWVFSTQNLYLPYRVRADHVFWKITP